MTIKLPFLAIVLSCVSLPAMAQTFPGRVYDGYPNDSAVISFASGKPMHSPLNFFITIDTSHTALWRSGTTSKPFFNTGAAGNPGIMTDTATPYPVRANDWIGIKISKKVQAGFINPIVSFTHKYQTAAGRDGGTVEYSFDSLNWYNVVKGCFSNVPTDSFYKSTDTLPGPIPAFSGTSGWKRSRFQFFQGLPLKGGASCSFSFPIWLRFRFISDTTADTLAGWLISSITIEQDYYAGGINEAKAFHALAIFPNPAQSVLSLPQLVGQEKYTLRITDLLGNVLYCKPYPRILNIATWPAGTYYYRADNGAMVYGGYFQKE